MTTNPPNRMGKRGRWWGATLLALCVVAAPVTTVSSAQAADVPTVPVAAPFDAAQCENTEGNPAVDADGGPVANLLSVFGQRLTDYNSGKPVILYNNSGNSGWTSGDSQYAANPLCATRYVESVGGPVSSWIYCTYDRASTCGWTNAAGQLERSGSVLPGLGYVDPDARLTADQQKLQSYIIQNDLPVIAGPNGSGGTVEADTVANNSSAASRSLRQDLVHCIDNPTRSSALEFCANNMSEEIQGRILEIIGADTDALLNESTDGTAVVPGADGEVHVTTTLAGIPLQLTVTGGTAIVCDGPATLTGTTLLVDVDAVLPADITLCVTRPDEGNVTVAVAGNPPIMDNIGFAQSSRFEGDTLCQIFSAVESERQTTLSAAVTVTFADAPVVVPSIGTSLVDAADGDRVLPWNGGTLVDTVEYQNLDVNDVSYTVFGELIDKSTGLSTGIVGQTTFVPSSPSGTVHVTFVVPVGYAGKDLVAFEKLRTPNSDSPDGFQTVAVHEDINDAAQTVTVEKAVPAAVAAAPKNDQLASTGAEFPQLGFGAAGLFLVAGAVVLLARQRSRSRS